MRLLFVAARFPQKPFQGDQARCYNQVRLLARHHRISFVSFVDKPTDSLAYEAVAKYCEQVVLVPRPRVRSTLNLLRGLTNHLPFQTLLYQSPQMIEAIERMLANSSFDLAHIQLLRMAPYLQKPIGIPRVIDLIDALSINMERRYRLDRTPARLAAFLEWKRLKRYENVICESYDRVLVVSDRDRKAIGPFDNLRVNAIGVSSASLNRPEAKRDPLTLVFTGNMFYYPNVDAVLYFSREILPLIREHVPGVRFKIVGARPTKSVRALTADPAITITGFVEDIAAHLETSGMAVCPMRAGSGMQFKVIEAMASGTPVVATPLALGGLDAVPGEHLLIGNNAPEIATQVVQLIRNPGLAHQLSQNGRALVKDRYTWEASINQLIRVYEELVPASSAASTEIVK